MKTCPICLKEKPASEFYRFCPECEACLLSPAPLPLPLIVVDNPRKTGDYSPTW